MKNEQRFHAEYGQIWTSDENDVQPWSVDIIWDGDLVTKAKEILAQNPWVEAVKLTQSVDGIVNDGYQGKDRGHHLIVSRLALLFKFYNDNTDTVYTVEIPETSGVIEVEIVR